MLGRPAVCGCAPTCLCRPETRKVDRVSSVRKAGSLHWAVVIIVNLLLSCIVDQAESSHGEQNLRPELGARK